MQWWCGLHRQVGSIAATCRRSFSVAIVGAGPVGLTLAILLKRMNLRVVVLERLHEPSNHPRAHFINMRSMEIFRELHETIPAKLVALSPAQQEWRRFSYCSSVLGKQIASFDHFKDSSDKYRSTLSPERVLHLNQPDLLNVLLSHAQSLGIEVKFGTQVLSCSNGSDHKVQASVKHLNTGGSETFTCEYLVGTDGASSTVRESMKIPMTGNEKTHNFIGIHFHCPNILPLLEARGISPSMLSFIFNQHTIGVLVSHDISRGNFILQLPYFFPFQTLEEDFSQDKCKALIRHAFGADIQPTIMSVRAWRMTAKVAERYARESSLTLYSMYR